MPPLRIADYDTRKKFDLTKFLVLLTLQDVYIWFQNIIRVSVVKWTLLHGQCYMDIALQILEGCAVIRFRQLEQTFLPWESRGMLNRSDFSWGRTSSDTACYASTEDTRLWYSEKVRPYNVSCAEAPLNSDWISMPPLYQGKMLAPAYSFNFCLSDHVNLTNNLEHAMHSGERK